MIRKKRLDGYFFFLPGFLFFSFFLLYPFLINLYYSFFDYRLSDLSEKRFVGLTNYRNVIFDDVFWITLKNIAIYGLISVPGQMFFGFIVAYALNQSIRGVKLFRIAYFLPVITSWVVASLIFKFIFTDQGLFNYVVTDVLHLVNRPISWLSDPHKGIAVLGLLGIWKGVGWAMVIYLAALQGVPKDLYEAAELDGCGRWQKIWHITLPSIRSTTMFIQIMLIIGAFNVFTSVYLVTGGGPRHQTEVMLTWMYLKAFQEYDLGYASALSYVFAMIIGLLTWIQFRVNRSE